MLKRIFALTHGRTKAYAILALCFLLFIIAAQTQALPALAAGRAPDPSTTRVLAPAGTASHLAVGSRHTCVATAAGLQCWGANWYGQLGNNSIVDSIDPVRVNGLAGGILALAASGYHTCAVTSGGGAKCWGWNGNGQLGNNSTTDSHVPVDVTGLSGGIVAIATGSSHTCALTSAGGVKCWGRNNLGQLGNSSTTDSRVPVDVSGLSTGVAAIALGDSHSCALTTSGGVKCWGGNWNGQLGNNSKTESHVPVEVTGLTSGASAIAVGSFHTCALVGGSVKCWGENGFGQLGNDSTAESLVPMDVTDLTSGVQAIAAGYYHTCAVSDGHVKCWGMNNAGQLGNNSTTNSHVPVDVTGLSSVVGVGGGFNHTCALTSGGDVKCWGLNDSGQLGIGVLVKHIVPVDVTGLSSGAQAISAGTYHTCALTSGGGIKCWGANNHGQLGNNSTAPSGVPVDVTGLTSGVAAISASTSHTCALMGDGKVKCWGWNGNGQLGNNSTTDSPVPVEVSGLTGATALGAGDRHTCAAVPAAPFVKCWGGNWNGQLGDNSTTPSPVPVDVSGLTGQVISIDAGLMHTCAAMAAGGIQCWGFNAVGQLGDGSNTDRHVPVPVSGITAIAAVSTGYEHTCTALSTGAKCWGVNYDGELGNNSVTGSNVPVTVSGLTTGITDISAGSYHTCAVVNGGAKCWGYNYFGQLGNNSTSGSWVPMNVNGLSSGVTSLSAGDSHTCAVVSGGAKCWGALYYGQLGNGEFGFRSTPADVVGILSGSYLYLPVIMK